MHMIVSMFKNFVLYNLVLYDDFSKYRKVVLRFKLIKLVI